LRFLPIALTTPTVTELESPYGFPITIAFSPTFIFLFLFAFKKGKSSSSVTLRRAISYSGSLPNTKASYSLPLINLTFMPIALEMRCSFVTIMPLTSSTTPEPIFSIDSSSSSSPAIIFFINEVFFSSPETFVSSSVFIFTIALLTRSTTSAVLFSFAYTVDEDISASVNKNITRSIYEF